MRHSWILVVAGLPLLLAASPPPNRPLVPSPPNNVVEIGFFDRLLQDNNGRRQSKSGHRRTRTNQQSRPAPTPAPAPAGIPIPTPKPTDGAANSVTPEQPKPDQQKIEPAPLPAPAVVPQASQATPAAEVPAKPAAPAEKPPVAAEPSAPAETPTVRQPATATEPAHDADVPKPLAKPAEETPAKPEAASPPAAGTEADKPSPDAAQPGAAEPPKPEEKPVEPPLPIASEDPEELKACLADLEGLGTKFKPIDRIDDGEGCGIDKPIEVAQILPNVDLGGAVMRCETAKALGHWLKDTVTPAMSVAMPGRRITGIVPGSTYACRLRNSAATGKISEHARGNGFDVAAFKFDNGDKMEMTPRGDDHTMEGAFQRTVTAGACLHFTTVLAPGSDASHETHMHLDVIDRKGGYRICE